MNFLLFPRVFPRQTSDAPAPDSHRRPRALPLPQRTCSPPVMLTSRARRTLALASAALIASLASGRALAAGEDQALSPRGREDNIGRVLLDHDADRFRVVDGGGAHNALNYDKPLEDQTTATTCNPRDDFVRTSGGQFTLGGERFVFAGWNQWEVLEAASDAPPPFRHLPLPGREHIVRVMNEAVRAGLKVVRMWAHTITRGHAAQVSPGVWNEEVLEGMDFVLDQARRRGLKIIWALADNWYPVGGVMQYVEWSATASRHQDFFTDESAMAIFESTFETLANRVNTINGVAYKDDATIFAWNLANEARCQGCDAEVMQSWIERVCAKFKTADPNHLVGIGYEGFYHESSGRRKFRTNPGKGGSRWAAREGQDFVRNARATCVDYVGVHVWPDNWDYDGVDNQVAYIESRVRDAVRDIGKPFVLEEFGYSVTDPDDTTQVVADEEGGRKTPVRDAYFASAYDASLEAARAGTLSGTLFWHWYDRGVGPGKYGVRSDDSTFELIVEHAEAMNAITGAPRSCAA